MGIHKKHASKIKMWVLDSFENKTDKILDVNFKNFEFEPIEWPEIIPIEWPETISEWSSTKTTFSYEMKVDQEMLKLFYGQWETSQIEPSTNTTAETTTISQSLGNEVFAFMEKAIPGFSKMEQGCPIDRCEYGLPNYPLKYTIIHLNDSHQWTREQISDWLDTLDHDLRFNY